MPYSKNYLPHGKSKIASQGANYYTLTGTLGDNNILTGSLSNGSQWSADLSNLAGGGGGSGTVAASPQFEIPFYSTVGTSSTISGSSNITYNSTNESLNVISTIAGDSSVILRNTNAASTANGFSVFDENNSRRLDVGFNNNLNESYLWSYAADVPLKIATNNTERMRILAGGNVGINTNNPSALLHVISGTNGYAARFDDGILLDGTNVQLLGYGQGNLWLMGNSGNPKLTLGYSHNWNYQVSLEYLKNATPNVGLSEFKVGQTQKNATTYDHGITSFYTSGSETMRLTANNRVGIGTTTPNELLDVSGNQKLYGHLEITGAVTDNPGNNHLWASGTGLYWGDKEVYTNTPGTSEITGGGSSGQVTYFDGTSNVTGSANFTFTSDNRLDIVPSNAEAKIFLGAGNVVLAYTGSKGKLNSANRTLLLGNSGAEIKMLNGTDDSMHFYTNGSSTTGTERLTILSGGNVGIGTTTPAFALDVNGDIRIEDAHFLRFGDDDSDSQWAIQHAGADLNFAEVGVADNVLFLEAGGRVGVGTNNPDGGWLHVNSAGTDQTLKLESTDGNVDTIFKDTGGSGIIRFATDTFKFYTDSAYSVNPLNLKGANVGIGTVAPGKKLHVQGDIAVSGASTAGDAGKGHSLFMYNQTGTQVLEMYADSRGVSGGKALDMNVSGRLNISSTEHLGIGPSSTGEYLHLFSGPTSHMYLDAGDSFLFRDKDDSSAIRARLYTATGKFILNDSTPATQIELNPEGVSYIAGNFGVGLGNPQSFSDRFSAQIGSDSGWPIGFVNAAEDVKGGIRTDQGDNYIAFASKSESDIRFFYNDAEANTALIIVGSGANAGNVGIGGTTNPSYPLHVMQGGNTYGMYLFNNGSKGIYFGDTSNNGTGYGKIGGVGGSLFLGSTQVYTSLIGTGDANTTLGSSSRRWSYFFARYGQFGYSTSDDENSGSGGYVLGVSGNADRHPFMVKAYGDDGVPSFIVTSGSNVGVGLAAPDKKFVIRTGGTRDFKFYDYDMTYESSLGIRAKNGGYLGLVTEGANSVFISTNGFANKRLVVDSAGLVGIGTTNPLYKLHLKGAGTTEQRIETTDSGAYSRVQLRSATDGYSQFNMGDSGADAAGGLDYAHSTDTLSIRAANAVQLSLGSGVATFTTTPTVGTMTSSDNSTKAASTAYVTTAVAAGGGGSAAGSDTQVQFNDGGSSFGGDAGLTYVKGTDTLTVASNININANLISGSSGHLQLYAADNVNLNSFAGITNFNYRGAETFRIAAGASSPVTLQPKASGYDLVLAAQDGTAVLHLDSTDKRIGIGTTNPSAKFSVTNAASQWAAYVDQNNTGNLAMKIEGNYGLGIETAGQYPLDISTASSADALRMLDNGNLGIGTVTPSMKLDVVSTDGFAGYFRGTSTATIASDTTNNNYLRVKNASIVDATTALLGYQTGNGYVGGIVGIEQYDADDGNNVYANLVFGTKEAADSSPNRRMTILHNGNVGIGTSSPSTALDVIGAIKNSSYIHQDADSSSTGVIVGAGGDANVSYDGSDMRIESRRVQAGAATGHLLINTGGGNVGIGIPTPAYTLDVSSGYANAARLYLNEANNYIMGESDNMYLRAHNDMYFNIDTPGDSVLRHFIWRANTSSELMRLGEDGILEVKSTGKVGIGTAAPAGKLEVIGDAGTVTATPESDAEELVIRNNHRAGISILSSDSASRGGYIVFGGATDNNAANIHHNFNAKTFSFQGQNPDMELRFASANNVEAMRIDTSQNVGIGTDSPGQSLDVDGNVRVRDSHTLAAGDSDDFYLYHDGNSTLRNNTGIFNITQNATSNLVMTTNGNSNQLVLEQANGKVGIGTAGPNQKLEVAGNITTTALDSEYRFANRSDLLIRGNASFDMELISPQDMAFGIDADNNETAHKFLFKTNSTTPSSAGTTLMEISEAGDVSITGGLAVTGSTLAVQKTMKNDIVGAHTFSDSYSHYLATADNMGDATCTLTCPASPTVGDEYFIVARCVYASAAGGSSLVRIQPNTGQTINAEVNNGSYIALNSLSSGTGAGGGPLMNYKTAHLICVDADTWALTLSDVGPTS